MKEYTLSDEAYILATETLGELAWGVGLSPAIPVQMWHPIQQKVITMDVPAGNVMQPLFEKFVERMRENETYCFYDKVRREANTAQCRIIDLEAELSMLKDEIAELKKSPKPVLMYPGKDLSPYLKS